jgi:hypothetical protein
MGGKSSVRFEIFRLESKLLEFALSDVMIYTRQCCPLTAYLVYLPIMPEPIIELMKLKLAIGMLDLSFFTKSSSPTSWYVSLDMSGVVHGVSPGVCK